MTNIVSIDFGFGNIKAVTESARTIFKSAFSQSEYGFIVGDKAIKNAKVIYPQTIDDLITLYPHAVKEACNRFCLSEKEIHFVCGLPMQAFKSDEVRTKLKNSFYENGIHDVSVYPQTYSCAWLLSQAGNSLIIDIGFNTVITCLVSQEKEILYSRTYYHHGAVSVAEKFNDVISNIFASTGKTLSLPELDTILQKKVFQLGLDIYDYTEKIREIKEIYIKETIFKIIKDIKVNLSSSITFSSVFIVGGLANEVNLVSEKINIIIPTDSIYSNAKAFLIRKISGENS